MTNGSSSTTADSEFTPRASSPLFLHSSDIPGMSLVVVPFSGYGFGGWRRSIIVSFSARNKIAFNDGSFPKPVVGSPKSKQWDRYEKQRQVTPNTHFIPDLASFNANATTPTRFPPHFQPQRQYTQKNKDLFYKYCKKSGHTIDKCYKLIGFPQGYKFTKGRKFGTATNVDSSENFNSTNVGSNGPVSGIPGLTMEQYSQLLSLLQQSSLVDSSPQPNFEGSANFAGSNLSLPELNGVAGYSACMLTSVARSVWIVDSGATDHMTSAKELLFNITPVPIPYLISLPNGYKDLSRKKLLVLGRLDQGLYKLHHLSSSSSSAFVLNNIVQNNVTSSSLNTSVCSLNESVVPSVSFVHSVQHVNNLDMIWHNRMGHLPLAKLKCIPSVSSDLSNKQPFTCSICPLARQARLFFPDNDFNMATWTHLMSSKSNAFSLLKAFISMVKTQFNLSVQTIKSDNALELGYKLYNLKNKSTFVSRDVLFHEFIFPLHLQYSSSPSPSSLFPPGFPSYLDESTSKFSFDPPSSPSYFFPFPSVTSSPTSNSPAPISPTPVSPFPVVRKSTRSHHLPSHLQNYVVQLPPSIFCSSTASTSVAQHAAVETHSYAQAAANPAWQEAMRKQFEALKANGTWDIVELPKAYAVKQKWSLFQLDANNAFVHGDLDEEVYMKLPLVLSVASDSTVHTLVCKLNKSLYGLRQASRQWYAKLSHALCSRGYSHSLNDYSLFMKKSPQSTVFLAVYVDDIILTGDDMLEIFISDLLVDFDCSDVSSVVCPLDLYDKLHSDVGDFLLRPDTYRNLIGKLNFLTHTRPDICFDIQHLSQFLQTPRVPHMAVALHLLRYLKGTSDVGLFLNDSADCSLVCYCDSVWAACPDSRRSVSGFCVFLGDSLIS
ncbi:uncharacterized protein [Nicotiana sylvestris]|uniref:uncharacterized protein n=1 Tax=Nicotiana sylvestris TaxID=4096 RepID=UPI00388CA8FB